MKYILGRENLAVTVFVPYDCPNNCKFCTSKKDYADRKNFSMQAILKSLDNTLKYVNVKDLVITGGEPFANLPMLQKIIDKGSSYDKRIYINTTLPVRNETERQNIIDFIEKNHYKLNGINVSRHIIWKNKLEDDTMLNEIDRYVPVRINSVLFGYDSDPTKSLIDIKKVKAHIEKYQNITTSMAFRGDYRQIKDMNDLKGFDSFFMLLNSLCDYKRSGGCLVCNDDTFIYDSTYRVSYHRGKESSAVVFGDKFLVNDIIIKPDGKILLDWLNTDGKFQDLECQWDLSNTYYSRFPSYPSFSNSCGLPSGFSCGL